MNDLPVVFDKIPKFLREFCLWCVWLASYVSADGVTRNGKFPCSPLSGKMIRVNEPSEWHPFDPAAEALGRTRRFSGLGVLIQPEQGLVGIDLDDCISKENVIKPWAVEILQRFETYA